MSNHVADPIPEQEPADGLVGAVELVVTDEELVVMFESEPAGLVALFPDEVPTPSPPVKSAVRRSMVARRALWPNADDTGFVLAEPWVSIIEAVSGASPLVRVTVDGDDARATLVFPGERDVVTIARDPRALNEVVFVASELAAAAVAAPFIAIRGELSGPVTVPPSNPPSLPASALESGIALLNEGHADEARRRLGDAFDLIQGAAGTHYRLEVMVRADPNIISGLDIDVFGAHDYGWLLCLPREQDRGTVDLRFVDDAGLGEFILEQCSR